MTDGKWLGRRSASIAAGTARVPVADFITRCAVGQEGFVASVAQARSRVWLEHDTDCAGTTRILTRIHGEVAVMWVQRGRNRSLTDAAGGHRHQPNRRHLSYPCIRVKIRVCPPKSVSCPSHPCPGQTMVNFVPSPGMLSTEMAPPQASVSDLAMASPRPDSSSAAWRDSSAR